MTEAPDYTVEAALLAALIPYRPIEEFRPGGWSFGPQNNNHTEDYEAIIDSPYSRDGGWYLDIGHGSTRSQLSDLSFGDLLSRLRNPDFRVSVLLPPLGEEPPG